MGERPLILRDWAACDRATQTRAFGWAEHPDVPAHADRSMVAMAVVKAAGKVPLSANCLGAHSWVVYDVDRPVAFLSAELLARWSPPEVFFPVSPDIALTGPTMTFSTLVDPELWGRGYATAAKMAACDHPAAALAATFHVCIRDDNDRSLKAIAKLPGVELIGTGAYEGFPWKHFRWDPRVVRTWRGCTSADERIPEHRNP